MWPKSKLKQNGREREKGVGSMREIERVKWFKWPNKHFFIHLKTKLKVESQK